MSRLHLYTVHVNPALPHSYEKAQFIEEGFSWKAFVFTFFWSLYHRLWLSAVLMVIADILLMSLHANHSVAHAGYFILHMSVHVVAGLFGNDWRRAKLARHGYITADLVTGDSELAAELRFFDRYFAGRSAAA